MAICVECEWHKDTEDDIVCNNSELPITDFVYGIRYCVSLNLKGNCAGFKPQSQPESIYELKEDDYRGPLLPENEHEESFDPKTFTPIETHWLCTICHKITVQNLNNDAPLHCFDCVQKQNEKMVKTGLGEIGAQVINSLANKGIKP